MPDPTKPIDPTGPIDPSDPVFDSRLSRLAPEVDPEVATTAFSHRRAGRARRRRVVASGSLAAAVLALVGLGAVVAMPGDDGEQVLAGSTTEVPEGSTTVPLGLDEDQRRTTVSSQGLTLSMDTPKTAEVGGRMWVDVTLANDRSERVAIDMVAACHEPLGALAGSIGAVNAVEADTGFGAFAIDQPGGSAASGTAWSGAPEELPEVLGAGLAPKVHAGRTDAQIGSFPVVCDASGGSPDVLDPGVSVTRRIAIDLRWVTPDSVDGTSIEVLASTGLLRSPDGGDLGKVTVQQPVALLDPVDRVASFEAALASDGMASAPTLVGWIQETGAVDPSGPPQGYQAEMTWWNGAWEAWILPQRGAGHQVDPLRIRFDPERGEVVDVRTVFGGSAPSDDPDQPDPLPAPVDELRYSAG